MRFAVWAFMLAVAFCSCSRDSDEKQTPVSFEIKAFRAESKGGCKTDTLQCAYFEVTYPEFSGLDTAVSSIIRRKIDSAVSLGNPESQGQSMAEIGEIFIKQDRSES